MPLTPIAVLPTALTSDSLNLMDFPKDEKRRFILNISLKLHSLKIIFYSNN